jgi:hypothetical protein
VPAMEAMNRYIPVAMALLDSSQSQSQEAPPLATVWDTTISQSLTSSWDE